MNQLISKRHGFSGNQSPAGPGLPQRKKNGLAGFSVKGFTGKPQIYINLDSVKPKKGYDSGSSTDRSRNLTTPQPTTARRRNPQTGLKKIPEYSEFLSTHAEVEIYKSTTPTPSPPPTPDQPNPNPNPPSPDQANNAPSQTNPISHKISQIHPKKKKNLEKFEFLCGNVYVKVSGDSESEFYGKNAGVGWGINGGNFEDRN